MKVGLRIRLEGYPKGDWYHINGEEGSVRSCEHQRINFKIQTLWVVQMDNRLIGQNGLFTLPERDIIPARQQVRQCHSF